MSSADDSVRACVRGGGAFFVTAIVLGRLIAVEDEQGAEINFGALQARPPHRHRVQARRRARVDPSMRIVLADLTLEEPPVDSVTSA